MTLTGAKSLHQLSLAACIANSRYLFDVGEAPYDVVRPVLLKIENPDQLRKIEKASPQIRGADAEIWRNFLKRDIPDWQSKALPPQNPKNWGNLHKKLINEADETRKRSAADLKEKLNKLDAEKASQRITFDQSLTDRMPKVKRHIQPQQIRPKLPDSSLLTMRSGSKTKTTTGKSILNKARREAKEASRFTSMLPSRSNPPQTIPSTQRITSTNPSSVQSTKEEALARRQRALAQNRTLPNPSPAPLNPAALAAAKRPRTTNVFMPAKKRRT